MTDGVVATAGGDDGGRSTDGRLTRDRFAFLAKSSRSVLSARLWLRHADHVGARVRLRGRPYVSNWGRMVIHDRVQLVSTVVPLELVTTGDGLLEIGERTLVNYGTSIAASELVRIGPDCLIGTYTLLMDSDFHRLEPERRMEAPDAAPIILERNVWLGARVIVLKGVTIGAGSVIAAGSLVTHDVPPRCLAGGMPAKVLRRL